MTELSYNEGLVVDVVRELSKKKSGEAVSAEDVRARAWQGYGTNYDQTFRALRGLVEKGVLEKPKRGWYRVPEKP